MTKPDLASAKQYVLQRLERELSPELVYHSLPHTRDEVVPAVERLAAMEGVTGEPLLLLVTAAYYHDIGFVKQRNNHEIVGIRMTNDILPRFGYTPDQLRVIRNIILATRIPQSPHTLLEEIIADADLDSLGRVDFWERSLTLRAELATFRTSFTDPEWCEVQKKFLQSHRYFTASARKLRDEQKRRNIRDLFDRCQIYCEDFNSSGLTSLPVRADSNAASEMARTALPVGPSRRG